jgi:hypothetical protein
MTVKVYDDADADGVIDAAESTASVYIVWQVIPAGASGVVAPANTRVSIVDAASTTYTGTTDTRYANQVLNGNEGRINLKLYDGLEVAYTADNKSVTFTVKSGDCLVGATGAQTLKFYSPATVSGEVSAFTAQATADAPTSCVIEVAVEGTVVATKTITHQGVVKTITVSDVEIADAVSGGSAQTGLATVRAYDAANNSIGALTLAEGTGANSFVSALTINNSSKTISPTLPLPFSPLSFNNSGFGNISSKAKRLRSAVSKASTERSAVFIVPYISTFCGTENGFFE